MCGIVVYGVPSLIEKVEDVGYYEGGADLFVDFVNHHRNLFNKSTILALCRVTQEFDSKLQRIACLAQKSNIGQILFLYSYFLN